MFANRLILYVLLNFLASGQCFDCDFFENFKVIVTPRSRVPYFLQYQRKNFKGCMEPKQFDQVIAEIAVVDQNITELGDHAVHDLTELESLSFTGCDIRNVSKRAFENLPKLRNIHIDHCNLTTIYGGSFNDLSSLEDLSLFQNRISEISSLAFLEMSSLRQLILSRNQIHAIDYIWFTHTTNMTLLDFSHNKIRKIGRETFWFTPNLKDLFLDNNEIKYIQEGAFRNISNMEILSLRHNRITELNPGIFGDQIKIGMLHLSANYLNFLSQNLLRKLSVTVIELEGNPWNCLCLEQIQKWMVQNKVKLKKGFCKGYHVPQCAYGNSSRICSETIDERMTQSFLTTLRRLSVPVDDECANISS